MTLRGENPNKPTYEILKHLGDGRGDDVFLAHHNIFEGECVQKTVRMHGLEDALASNEPAFLHKLDHRQIVPVREAQWDPTGENAITFVMPLFPGGSVLDALRNDYRFSIMQAVTIAIDALDALGYLHREHHALHRDVKPGNVLLDENRARGFLHEEKPAERHKLLGQLFDRVWQDGGQIVAVTPRKPFVRYFQAAADAGCLKRERRDSNPRPLA